MKVIVALQQHFYRISSGLIYPDGYANYEFFRRYLEVFDQVIVFARLREVTELANIQRQPAASGPGVLFSPLPDFLGPWQFFCKYVQLQKIAKHALDCQAACILRVPGVVGTLLAKDLNKIRRPFALEVVGDPWDSLAPGSVKSSFRAAIRRKEQKNLKMQCQRAVACAYVTESGLQKRYPPGGWSTHYSSVELSPCDVIDQTLIERRLKRIEHKRRNNETWRIVFIGTLSQLYKAPDVLIRSVGRCLQKGLNLGLVLIGDGQFRVKLEQQVEKLGLEDKVTFIGSLPAGAAIYQQLDMSDLYVLPSRQEGLPRSVIEAMARGLPCIGSHVGGFPELLEDRYRVSPNDFEALANKITEVLTDNTLMVKAVRRNVAVADRYRSDVLAQRRTAFYRYVKKHTEQWMIASSGS